MPTESEPEPTAPRNPRGAGRKPKYPDAGAMATCSVRMPEGFWKHIRERGGDEYLRGLVAEDMLRGNSAEPNVVRKQERIT